MQTFYTGIGARATPPHILKMMTSLAKELNKGEFTLRSGGTRGADIAFEAGAGTNKEIYLPWKSFGGSVSVHHYISPEAYEMAKYYHPNWNACSPTAKRFHARNCYQVLGLDFKTPSQFIICWTPNGKVVGGTGQALRIAKDHNIIISNLGTVTKKQMEMNYD